MTSLSKAQLEQHHVWVSTDTRFRRRARLHQALWREKMGYPMGRGHGKPRGDRLAMPWAKESLANYLTPAIRKLVRRELAAVKEGQVFQKPRIYDHLLSSQPLCFNLFGEIAEDLDLATAVLRRRIDDLDHVTAVRFEHSPGRGDLELLGDGTAHDVFIEYTTDRGHRAFIGIEVKYVEDLEDHPAKHKVRYDEVAQAMGEFRPEAREALRTRPLEQIWRDHLLAGAMMRADMGYAHGRFMFLYPACNMECDEAVRAYGSCLAEETTFEAWTLESLVGDIEAARGASWAQFRDRYLW